MEFLLGSTKGELSLFSQNINNEIETLWIKDLGDPILDIQSGYLQNSRSKEFLVSCASGKLISYSERSYIHALNGALHA